MKLLILATALLTAAPVIAAAPQLVALVAPIAPGRVLTPRDCVTVGGCRLRAALEGRVLLKRDAEVTSEADKLVNYSIKELFRSGSST